MEIQVNKIFYLDFCVSAAINSVFEILAKTSLTSALAIIQIVRYSSTKGHHFLYFPVLNIDFMDSNKIDNHQIHSLKIDNLILFLYLGVSELEREFAQKVSLTLTINYKITDWSEDNLAKMICYDTLITYLKIFLQAKQYKTVEYLSEQVYYFIKNYSPSIDKIDLVVRKLRPPIQDEIEAVELRIQGVGVKW